MNVTNKNTRPFLLFVFLSRLFILGVYWFEMAFVSVVVDAETLIIAYRSRFLSKFVRVLFCYCVKLYNANLKTLVREISIIVANVTILVINIFTLLFVFNCYSSYFCVGK